MNTADLDTSGSSELSVGDQVLVGGCGWGLGLPMMGVPTPSI